MTDTTDQQPVTVAQEAANRLREMIGKDGRLSFKADVIFSDIGKRELETINMAIAALAFVSSASAEGLVAVPSEATEAMLEACGRAFAKHTGTLAGLYQTMWSAMLAASPEPVPATNQAGEVEPVAWLYELFDKRELTLERCPKRISWSETPLFSAPIEAERLAYKTGYSEAYEDCTGTSDHDAAEEGWGQYIERRPALATQPATSQEGEVDRSYETLDQATSRITKAAVTESLAVMAKAFDDLFIDRDEWRTQHEALLDVRHQDLAVLAATPTPPTLNSWANTPEAEHERILLMAEIELHLKSCRIFLTSREKMHPVGVDIHDELLAKVTASIEATGSEKAHG